MTGAAAVAGLARLLADESRAAMCLALLDGMPWTVTELAQTARVSVATASEHVTKLAGAGLVVEERVGRRRLVRLARPDVASAVEALTALTTPPAATGLRSVNARRRLAAARTCYDHLAGRLGVAVFDALVSRQVLTTVLGLAVSEGGVSWFEDLGIDVRTVARSRRTFLRSCMDWTERRPHLAGALGAELCATFLEREWVRRTDRTRALVVTPLGRTTLHDLLGIGPEDLAA